MKQIKFVKNALKFLKSLTGKMFRNENWTKRERAALRRMAHKIFKERRV